MLRDNTVYLDSDRAATSLKTAVISAINEVRSSFVNAEVASVVFENLITEVEMDVGFPFK